MPTYPCTACDKIFIRPGGLALHVPIHSGVTTFLCDFCNKAYCLKAHLRLHIQHHVTRTPYRCQVCSKSFRVKRILKTHLSKCHNVLKIYQCIFCDKSFKQSSQLKIHERVVHTGERPYVCSVCNKAFLTYTLLRVHSLVHTSDKSKNKEPVDLFIGSQAQSRYSGRVYKPSVKFAVPSKDVILDLASAARPVVPSPEPKEDLRYPCNLCDKSYISLSYFTRHLRTHSGASSLICDFCNKAFGSKLQLRSHIYCHLLKKKNYSCRICSVKFSCSRDLKNHKRRGPHPTQRNYVCGVCGKAFHSSANLNAHSRCHTRETSYACKVCGMKFIHCKLRDDHCRSHAIDKPYSCDACGKCFAYSSSLYRHYRIHTGVKPYSCKVCGRRFAHASSLEAHSRSHTLEKPYPCEICGRCFSTSSTRNTHRRTHTGEKPFSCSVCGRGFSSYSGRKSHSLTHSGRKQYSCDTCGKCFSHATTLKNHVRIHTEENPYSCPISDKRFISSASAKMHLKFTHSRETLNSVNAVVKGLAVSSVLGHNSKDQYKEEFYSCNKCGVEFENNLSLEKHQAYNSMAKCKPLQNTYTVSSASSQLTSKLLTAEYGTTRWNDERMLELKPCCVLLDDSIVRRYLEAKMAPQDHDHTYAHTAKVEPEPASAVDPTNTEEHEIDMKDEPIVSDTEFEDVLYPVQLDNGEDLTLKRESDCDLQSSSTFPLASRLHRSTNTGVYPPSSTPIFQTIMIVPSSRTPVSDLVHADVPEQPYEFVLTHDTGSDPLGACTSNLISLHRSNDTDTTPSSATSGSEQTAPSDPLDIKGDDLFLNPVAAVPCTSGCAVSSTEVGSKKPSCARSTENPAPEDKKFRNWIVCQICYLICASDAELVDHFKNIHTAILQTCLSNSHHHSPSPAPIPNQGAVSEVAASSTLTESGLAKVVHGQSPPIMTCPICNVMYYGFRDMKKHISNHNVCRPCGLSFATKRDMQLHRTNHKSGLVSMYACGVCTLTFKHFSACKLHAVSVHGVDENWSCVQYPMPNITTTARNRCPLCVEEFGKVLTLHAHINRHRTRPCTNCTNSSILKTSQDLESDLCSVCDISNPIN